MYILYKYISIIDIKKELGLLLEITLYHGRISSKNEPELSSSCTSSLDEDENRRG